MPPRMKIIIFKFLVLIKYFLLIISILGILVLAHRKNLVRANVYCTMYNVHISFYIVYKTTVWDAKRRQNGLREAAALELKMTVETFTDGKL